MRRSAWCGLLAAAALAGAVPAHAVVQQVKATPAVGDPDTTFHVEVAALYRIGPEKDRFGVVRDRYQFVLHGPGGKSCETTVTDRVGITPPRRAKRVFVDLPGVRVVSSKAIIPGPWCPGTFNGHVEFRDWVPALRHYRVHRIGTFSVQVQEAAAAQ